MHIEKEAKGSTYSPTVITGKAIERHFELEAALLEFSRLFNGDDINDRAIAIIGATFLEMQLEHILRNFLIDDEKEVDRLLEYDQPLGNFSGKITMAYCLGLIYKPVRDDLHLVRKIRNEFAHKLYASFEDQKIADWCSSLKWHRLAYVANPPGGVSARDFFQVGTNQLSCYLSGVVSMARHEKRTVQHYD